MHFSMLYNLDLIFSDGSVFSKDDLEDKHSHLHGIICTLAFLLNLYAIYLMCLLLLLRTPAGFDENYIGLLTMKLRQQCVHGEYTV